MNPSNIIGVSEPRSGFAGRLCAIAAGDTRTYPEAILRTVVMLAMPAGLTAICLRLPGAQFEELVARALVIAAAALFSLVILHRPQYGFYLLSCIGALIPLSVERSFPDGVSPTLLLAPLAIGAWLSFLIARPSGSRWYMSAPARPALLLMVGAAVSLGFGQYPWFHLPAAPLRAQLGALGLFLLSGGTFLAVQDVFRRRMFLRRLTWIFLLAAAIRLLLLVAPLPAGFLGDALASGTIGSVFWVWLVSIALSQALLNDELSAGWRLSLMLLLAGTGYITFFEWREWASGWLPAAVGSAVILALARPRLTLVLALFLIPVAVWKLDSIWSSIWIGDQAYSYMTRVEALRTLASLGEASPLFGLGPANYYHYTPVFPLLGWYVHFSSHNNYVDLFLQTGALGLFAFLWFGASLGRLTLRLRSKFSGGFERAYVLGAAGGLAGTLAAAGLGDWVIPFAYNVGVRGFAVSILAWIFLGGVAALASESEASPA
jgi:hypothetical protein